MLLGYGDQGPRNQELGLEIQGLEIGDVGHIGYRRGILHDITSAALPRIRLAQTHLYVAVRCLGQPH